MQIKAKIMEEADMLRALKRISHQIIENHRGCDNIVLMGIKTRGVPLAQKLAENILLIDQSKVPVGVLDITLYRDDLSHIADDPVVHKTEVDFDITGKDVILVDARSLHRTNHKSGNGRSDESGKSFIHSACRAY